MGMLYTLLLGVAFSLCSGCGRESQSMNHKVSKSLEGEVEVIHVRGMWSQHWPERVVTRIDTVLPPESVMINLAELSAVAVGDDGQVALVDGMTEEVWARLRRGGTWTRMAERGEGPAELVSASGAWWVGDTLGVFDGARRRVLWIAPSKPPASFALPIPGPRDASIRTVPFGDSGGFLGLLSAHPDPTAVQALQRPTLTVLWMPISSEQLEAFDTLGRWPGRTWVVRENLETPLPFGPDTYVHANRRGIVVADGALPLASVFDFEGNPRVRIQWVGSAREAQIQVDEFLERQLAAVPEETRPSARSLLTSLPYPETLPYSGGVLMGDNEVWVAKWFGTEVEARGVNWPRTEWRAVGILPPHKVGRITFPGGVLPVIPLSHSETVVILQDDFGRKGIGIAQLELMDGD
jgi:hypothetical protein